MSGCALGRARTGGGADQPEFAGDGGAPALHYRQRALDEPRARGRDVPAFEQDARAERLAKPLVVEPDLEAPALLLEDPGAIEIPLVDMQRRAVHVAHQPSRPGRPQRALPGDRAGAAGQRQLRAIVVRSALGIAAGQRLLESDQLVVESALLELGDDPAAGLRQFERRDIEGRGLVSCLRAPERLAEAAPDMRDQRLHLAAVDGGVVEAAPAEAVRHGPAPADADHVAGAARRRQAGVGQQAAVGRDGSASGEIRDRGVEDRAPQRSGAVMGDLEDV